MRVKDLLTALKAANEMCTDHGGASRAADVREFVAAFDGFENLTVEAALQRISAGRRRRSQFIGPEPKIVVASVLSAERLD